MILADEVELGGTSRDEMELGGTSGDEEELGGTSGGGSNPFHVPCQKWPVRKGL